MERSRPEMERDALLAGEIPDCAAVNALDTTRSRTRRWHAEDPCGWRERQRARRHPAVSSGQNVPPQGGRP